MQLAQGNSGSVQIPKILRKQSTLIVIAIAAIAIITVAFYVATLPAPMGDSLLTSQESNVVTTDGSVTVDHEQTHITVEISGPASIDGESINITTIDFGATMPLGTEGSAIAFLNVAFYDVQVTKTSDHSSLGSDVMVTVYITNPTFNNQSVMSYWSGSGWTGVQTEFIEPSTVKGTFKASDLTGTPIMVGDNKPPALVVPEYGIGALLAIFACFAAFATLKTLKRI